MAIGILLVGGFGTRLKPLTNQTPKPMLPVGGLPVTEHQLLAAKKAGITTVILATSYLSEVFIPYFGDGSKWGMQLKYAVEKEPLGTGGAIRNAAELIDLEAAKAANEEFVIFNGDVLSHHSIAVQLEFHRKNISDIPLNKVVSVERETFPNLVNSGRPVFGYSEQSYWLDIGTPAALFKGSRDLVNGAFAAGEGTTFGPDSLATGGSSIGANCDIGQGVTIDNSIIGDGVKIGDGAQIRDSFILHGSKVQASAQIVSKYLSPSENLEISPT